MSDGDLQITFRPRPEALAEVRRELREWLDGWVAPTAVVHELVLVADELCANAVDAARQGLIQLDARCDGSAVHLAVSNAGHADDDLSRPDPAGEPDPLGDRGRGLTIVRAFTDSLAIVNVDGRTVARAVRLLT
ncbi:MAG TPA: ATP-binding protein [Acidimicrobiales bacterium]|jgi:anti-sigma regulatory factor (Ser/Thr protein kinase)